MLNGGGCNGSALDGVTQSPAAWPAIKSAKSESTNSYLTFSNFYSEESLEGLFAMLSSHLDWKVKEY
jgi:hypothetical protein